MASVIIHMCVASEISKKIKIKNYNEYLLGSIAPDVAKLVGESRAVSHFINDSSVDYPNMELFLKKYKKDLNNDFILGYYVHLYTDYLWFKYFMREFKYNGVITLKNGKKLNCDEIDFRKFLYSDYTNLNIQLLDEYDIDLSLFYNPLVIPDIKMDEIPLDKLQVLLDFSGNIVKNSKTEKEYLFDISNVREFISVSTDLITGEIQKNKG